LRRRVRGEITRKQAQNPSQAGIPVLYIGINRVKVINKTIWFFYSFH
jgi:hypothetical protein